MSVRRSTVVLVVLALVAVVPAVVVGCHFRGYVAGFMPSEAAEMSDISLPSGFRITVYVSDLHRVAPLVSKVQAELWGKPHYPPRTMFEVKRLFDDDIVEIDSIFYAPTRK